MYDNIFLLEDAILAILRARPEGMKEFDLITALRGTGCEQIPRGPLSDHLLLFHTHFIVFHALYRLRDRLWQEQKHHLEITPLRIILRPYQPGKAGMAEYDALREYYLNLANLNGTTEDDVANLLHGFWVKFHAGEERLDALAELGLREPVDYPTIKSTYRSLAREHHPDRGGDTGRFRAISNAMDVLDRYYRD